MGGGELVLDVFALTPILKFRTELRSPISPDCGRPAELREEEVERGADGGGVELVELRAHGEAGVAVDADDVVFCS